MDEVRTAGPLSAVGYVNAVIHRLLPRRIMDLRLMLDSAEVELRQCYYRVAEQLERLPVITELTADALQPALALLVLGQITDDYFDDSELTWAYGPQIIMLPSLDEIGRGRAYEELVELQMTLHMIDYAEAKLILQEQLAAGCTREEALASVGRWSYELGMIYTHCLFCTGSIPHHHVR